MKTVMVTGGAGFIGSEVVRQFIAHSDYSVVNVDKLSYAGSLAPLAGVAAHPRYRFEQVDICDAAAIAALFVRYRPQALLHLAAESHVDRSIDGPAAFIQSNIVGTYTLLETARQYWLGLSQAGRAAFRFLHVSTDEVYGSVEGEGSFSEQSPYAPNSPYAASKASADHLVRAWHHTYGLPVLTTHCSNNYGPWQYPEKLIPRMISNALAGRPLPIYGRGDQVRDWLHVADHARALRRVLEDGVPGEAYTIGGNTEWRNLQLVQQLCAILDELAPQHPAGISRYAQLITHVADRPGHDQRYAIDAGKITRELGWAPHQPFAEGLRQTVAWYLANRGWCDQMQHGAGARWNSRNTPADAA